jgi:hypothetical protein
MEWDEEELDTQIFDKDSSSMLPPVAGLDPAALFQEDNDRTVASEPPPDMLRAATAPEHLATPQPEVAPAPPRGKGQGQAAPPLSDHTAKAARPMAPPGRAAARSTLAGVPLQSVPRAGAAPQARSGGRISGQGPAVGAPGGTGEHPSVPPRYTAPRTSTAITHSAAHAHAQPHHAHAHGRAPEIAAPTAAPVMRPSRGGLYATLVVLALAVVAGTAGWYYWSLNKPGTIQLTVVPDNATVLIDNVKVGERSPTTVTRPPGPYMLSVTHDGYVRNDQNVELRAGQQLKLAVTLEASPDTGFELTSEPPGGLVWLDGAPINGANGQARTDFRAYRIASGHHVIEIKGEAKFKPWKQDVEIEPGAIKKIHALLTPTGAPDAPSRAQGTGAVARGETKVEAKAPEAKGETKVEARAEAKARPSEAAVRVATAGGGQTGGGSSGGDTPSAPARTGRRRRAAREAAVEPAGDAPETSAAAVVQDSPKGESAPPEGGDCSITIGSRPWSEVWIDGKNTNKHTPFADYKIPCGKHKLSFKRPDLQIDHSETISVRQGQKFKQSFTLETEPEP